MGWLIRKAKSEPTTRVFYGFHAKAGYRDGEDINHVANVAGHSGESSLKK